MEYGALTVDDPKTCEEAAEEIQERYQGTEDKFGWPKGCYLNNGVFFNHHSTGSGNKNAKQICHPIGKFYDNSPTYTR